MKKAEGSRHTVAISAGDDARMFETAVQVRQGMDAAGLLDGLNRIRENN